MKVSSWFARYLYVATVNAFIAVVWTILFAIPDLNLPRIIASGWPGTWLFVGYVLLVIIGCPAMVLCGIVNNLLYQITTKTLNEALTWIHIILTEIGVVGSTVLLGVAGYIGGRLALEKQPIPVIHESIIGYALPTTVFVGVAVIGALLAIINLWMTVLKKPAL